MYRLAELSIYELYFIQKAFIDDKKGFLKTANQNWLNAFTYLQKIKEKYKDDSLPQEVVNFINEVEHNLSEDMHMNIENNGYKYLEKLKKRDTSFFNDPDMCSEFISFFPV